MPHLTTTTGFFENLINVPVPGDNDTGGIVGGIIDIIDAVGGAINGPLPTFPQPTFNGGPPPLPRFPNTTGNGPIITTPVPNFPVSVTGCISGPVNPCCQGEHLNKSRDCFGNPAGSKCVTNRRMNPLNPRALRRAIRRAKGFERFVKSNRKSLRSLAKI